MSLATVYKTLDFLNEIGEVSEINLHDNNHYDAIRPFPHPHLICTGCQNIMEGEMDAPIRTLVNKIKQDFSFHIHSHQLNFYGLCPDCQKSAPKIMYLELFTCVKKIHHNKQPNERKTL